MPTTILAGFQALRSNLEISGLQASTVSTRQTNVRGAVEEEFDVLASFVSGSYSRSTLIAPLKSADIDIFVVLDPKYHAKYSPAGLLDRVRTVLLRTYPKTPNVSRNGQAVTISFTDFHVDVVPGFYRQGGGYLIPNSITGTWISTNPKQHDAEVAAANKDHAGNLVPLIKMVKGWNRGISDAFVGFYLELMTKKILTGISISDLPSGVRYVLERGQSEIRYVIADPAGFGGQVSGLNNVSKVDDAVSRFRTATGRAKKAEQLAREGKVALAYDEWRKIFPGYFPAYG